MHVVCIKTPNLQIFTNYSMYTETCILLFCLSVSLSPSFCSSRQQIISTLSCFWAHKLFQFWDLAPHEVDRTQAPYLALPVFSQLTIPFFFPDYRLSGSARIPFLTHQNGDIHLKDDICGEFLNNLIVIRHRRGQGGGYDGGEQGIMTYKMLKPFYVGVGRLRIKFKFGNSS